MANLGKKGDLYVARFRYAGKEYKTSLKMTSLAEARAAILGVEQASHRLAAGIIQLLRASTPATSSSAAVP